VAVRADARLVADSDGRGGTRLRALHSEPPLLLRRTGARTAPTAEVHLVGGAAGPLGGDDLRITIVVASGARLVVRTVAASLAQPSLPPAPSTVTVTARVEGGGSLWWLPEPLVAVAGCDHVNRSTVDLDEGAELRWREEIAAGRHGEDSGDLRMVSTVRYAGRTILRHDLAVGPRTPAWSGPAVLGGRAAGTLLLVGPDATVERAATGPTAAVMPLADNVAVLVSATGATSRDVRAALDKAAP